MQIRQMTKSFAIGSMCAILSVLFFWLIPLCSLFEGIPEKILSILIAALFWGSLLVQQIFFWHANAVRRKIWRKNRAERKKRKKTLGIITFFSNTEAIVCDSVCILTAIGSVILFLLRVQQQWLSMSVLGLFLLSFQFHCICNGTNYKYLKVIYKRKEGAEQYENA